MSGGESILAIILGTCHCSGAFTCDISIDNHVGILICFLLMVYMFKALGTICDEYFVPSLEVIVEKLQISNDVAGATFMAAGSSAPELFTALVATFLIVSSGGVGTIIGSAIFNIFVIVGVTGFVACKTTNLKIWWYPLTRDCIFYLISILELLAFLWDEQIEWYEALCMVCTYLLYILLMKFNAKLVKFLNIDPSDGVEKMVEEKDDKQDEIEKGPREGAEGEDPPGPPAHHAGLAAGLSGETPGEVTNSAVSHLQIPGQGEGEQRSPSKGSNRSSGSNRPKWSMHEQAHPQDHSDNKDDKKDDKDAKAEPDAKTGDDDEDTKKAGPFWWVKDPINLLWELTLPTAERNCWVLFALSILWIGICTFLMVDAVGRMGCILNIPPFVMGCTFLAAGTSIPDALGSIAVAKQGEGDMAVANALGSNVFDILLGLGFPWLIAKGVGKEVSFPGAKDELVRGILILVGVLVLFIGALAINKWVLSRQLGVVLMSMYLFFVAYNILVVIFDF